MRVIIAGGAGFIGSNLVEYWVKRKADVVVIDNLRTGFLKNISEFKEITFHKRSITERDFIFEAVKGADYIFNLAALVSVPESIEKPEETYDININGLKNLLDAATEHGIKKLVHTSSAAIYGDDPRMPKIETMEAKPISPYGDTKYQGELLCSEYLNKYGLQTIALRYFNVYGPKQNPYGAYTSVIPIFSLKALKKEPMIIYGDGEQTRDFVYVKDVVNANVLAAETENVNGVFNIANGNIITIKTLADKIKDITGTESGIIYKPVREGDIKHSSASVEKAKKELNFTGKTQFDDGLKTTIDYYRKELSSL
jgi:UDP-glucose 4-epimerase